MITRAIAKEHIQDRVREAERQRKAVAFRPVRTRKVASGLMAVLASAGLRSRIRREAAARVIRTA